MGDTTSLVPGFPIRTSSDPRSVDSSPRHNAASHVLHRLPVPRHPPCALKHLHTKQIKKYSRKNKNCIINNKQPPKKESHLLQMLATTIHKSNTTPHHQSRATTKPPTTHSGQGKTGLLSQSPIVCLAILHARLFPPDDQRLLCTGRTPTTGAGTDIPTATDPTGVGAGENEWCSLERR